MFGIGSPVSSRILGALLAVFWLAGCAGELIGPSPFHDGSCAGSTCADLGPADWQAPKPDKPHKPPDSRPPADKGKKDGPKPADGSGGSGGKPGTFLGLTLQVSGQTRHYGLHVPASYSAKVPMPLLFFFHGTDMTTDPKKNQQHYMSYTGLVSHANSNKYMVAFPSALPVSVPGYGTALLWEKNMSLHDAFVFALLSLLKGKYNVADKRVYIAGFSSGGFYVSHLFPSYSSKFAAFAMHGACSWSTYYDPPSKAARKIPGFIRIGSADSQFLSCAKQLYNSMLAAGWKSGNNVDYVEVPGLGHNYSAGQNSAQWQFLSKFSLP